MSDDPSLSSRASARHKPARLVEPHLLQISSGGAIQDQETLAVAKHEQRMVPDILGVVYALASARREGAVASEVMRVATHQHQPWLVLQRKEQLAAERV